MAELASLEALSRPECFALLATVPIGRLATTVDALPFVAPVNFVLVDGAVVVRTKQGTRLADAVRDAVVSFQADAIDPRYHEGWSVLLTGRSSEITEPDDLQVVRRLPLRAWAPGRDRFVRITPALVSGRRLLHGTARPAEPVMNPR